MSITLCKMFCHNFEQTDYKGLAILFKITWDIKCRHPTRSLAHFSIYSLWVRNPFKQCYKITSLNLRNLWNLGIKTNLLSFNLLDSNIHMFNSTGWIFEKKASSKCIRVQRDPENYGQGRRQRSNKSTSYNQLFCDWCFHFSCNFNFI